MISLLRPDSCTLPASSTKRPRSPVRNQPSAVNEAALAAARNVDLAGVLAQWPAMEPVSPPAAERIERLSAEVHEVLSIAEAHLAEYPVPHVLATEHLLLGLVAEHDPSLP